MYIFGMLILTFFAVIGVAVFITALYRARGADKHLSIVLSELYADNAEVRIRNAAELCSEIRCERLICECADTQTMSICARLSRDHPIIIIKNVSQITQDSQ